LVAEADYLAHPGRVPGLKIVYRTLSNATNERTIVAALCDGMPCGNSLGIVRLERGGWLGVPHGAAVMASLVYDWLMRRRIAGTNVSSFLLMESCWPKAETGVEELTAKMALGLALPGLAHASQWFRLGKLVPAVRKWPLSRLFALTPHERLRIRCMLDAVMAELHGLSEDDFRWILRDCDHPSEKVCDKPFSRSLDPKGFWRVDKDRDPELRHTVLSAIAFHDLKASISAHDGDRDRGIRAFCQRNGGEGWLVPETLRLADYGFGHDERARVEQPVADRLGKRFLSWQVDASPEESWSTCEVLAREMLGEGGFAELLREINAERPETPTGEPALTGITERRRTTDLFGEPVPTDLFGNPLPKGRRRGRR
jgi:hypothetical protein